MEFYAPILIFIFLTAIIGYSIYWVITIKSKESQNEFYLDVPEDLFELETDEYAGQFLVNAFYSVVNEYDFDLGSTHSVDNSIFLEFNNGKWISIMFNEVIEAFHITNEDPNLLELDYSLISMSKHKEWNTFIDKELENIEVEYGEYRMFDVPKDLKFNFVNEQMTISLTEMIVKKPFEVVYGVNWLLVQFSKKTFHDLRKAQS